MVIQLNQAEVECLLKQALRSAAGDLLRVPNALTTIRVEKMSSRAVTLIVGEDDTDAS